LADEEVEAEEDDVDSELLVDSAELEETVSAAWQETLIISLTGAQERVPSRHLDLGAKFIYRQHGNYNRFLWGARRGSPASSG